MLNGARRLVRQNPTNHLALQPGLPPIDWYADRAQVRTTIPRSEMCCASSACTQSARGCSIFCGVDRAAIHATAGWKPRRPWSAPSHGMRTGAARPCRSDPGLNRSPEAKRPRRSGVLSVLSLTVQLARRRRARPKPIRSVANSSTVPGSGTWEIRGRSTTRAAGEQLAVAAENRYRPDLGTGVTH
jgi:hypothetical protein